MKKYDVFLWMVTLVLGISVFFFPETIPVHWDISWNVDGYGSRYMLFIYALLPIVIYYGMLLTKKIDPRTDELKKRGKTYNTIRTYLSFFFVLFAVFFYYITLNPHSNGTFFISMIVGGMFIMLGNYMPKVPKNYFLGIRSPWTLASDVVWKKTHKVAGYGYVIAGLLTIIGGFMNIYWLIFISIIIVTIYVYVYSYVEYRKL